MKIFLRPRVLATLAVTTLAILAGCAEPYDPDPDAPPLLQPTGFAFTLERTAVAGYIGEIPHTFTNGTGQDVFFHGCGGLVPGLERRDGDQWVPDFGPVVVCIRSHPWRVVRGGESVAGVLSINAGRFGTTRLSTFQTPEVNGEYRLVLGEPFARVGGPDGPPLALPHRVSPGFYLSAPPWKPGDGR